MLLSDFAARVGFPDAGRELSGGEVEREGGREASRLDLRQLRMLLLLLLLLLLQVVTVAVVAAVVLQEG